MIGDGCFLAGTPVRVATALGQHDRPVETLQPGESVVTATGPLRVVAVEKLAPPPGPGGATIHLLPGALGPGRPRQDLVVTPEQLLFVQDEALPEGALAPAGALVNGRSILRAARTEQTPWYGVTLEGHGLPLVANLPAASRRDAGGALSARLLPPGPALFALRGRLTRAATAEAPPPPAATPEPPPAEAPPDDLPPNDLLPNDLPPGDLPSGEAPDRPTARCWRSRRRAACGASPSPPGRPACAWSPRSATRPTATAARPMPAASAWPSSPSCWTACRSTSAAWSPATASTAWKPANGEAGAGPTATPS